MYDLVSLTPLKAWPNFIGHIPIPGGFLRQTYGPDSIIANLCVVRSRTGEAVGLQLYFLAPDLITCKTEHGLSGQSFNSGVVTFGTVYDDDGPPDPGQTISKREWLSTCLGKMVAGLTEPT